MIDRMIDKIIGLRNRIHEEEFRFVLTPQHWKTVYMPENVESSNLATVMENGRLKGYAAYSLADFDKARAYDIRELLAEDKDTLAELIDQIIEKGIKENVDFIFVKRCEEPHGEVLAREGFLSFLESVIMISLFNPKELLSALSKQIEDGKVLDLHINGFDPISVRVGKKGIMIVKREKPDLTVAIDDKTFLRLFFGKTSFSREFFRRRITLNTVLNWRTANRSFNLIKQDRWYIPMGDWV